MRYIFGDSVLLRLWLAQMVSEFGDLVFFTALVVELYNRTESGLVLGVESAIRNGALIVVSVLAGPLVDRWRRRPVLYGADLVRGALLILPLMYPSIPVFIATSSLVVIASRFFAPARLAWIPSLVPDDRLRVVNGIFSVTTETIGVIGALAGGLLAAVLGFRGAILIDIATFFVSAVLIVSIPSSRDVVPEASTPTPYWAGLLDGFRYTYTRPVLKTLLSSFLVGAFAAGLIAPMTIVYVERGLRLGATGYGTLLAAMAIGGILSAVLLSRLKLTVAQLLVWVGYFATGVTLVLIGFVPGAAVSILLFVALGTFQNLQEATAITFFQQQIPGSMLGRFFGILNATTTPFFIGGMLTVGVVSERSSVGLIYLSAGALFVIGGAVLQLSPHFRSILIGKVPMQGDNY
ncbi:MAG: MFS transporter [Bacillota bacterium]